jgi:N-acetylglucosamine-6-phosphate deacetylase
MIRTQGLVDLQVNGFGGVDFNDDKITPQAMDAALEAALRTGVTTLLPTLITAHPQELEARFKALDHAVAQSRLGPLMCPGYHLEGPFLNPAPGFRGCHPHEAMTKPDAALVERLAAGLTRPILLVTYAPENDEGYAFAKAMREAGRLTAIGHSDVSPQIAHEAARAGVSLSTHLGNGCPTTTHKLDNTVFAQLAEDGLTACVIADGIHVPPAVVKVMIRAKGVNRMILVTDAVVGAAAKPGLYRFASMEVRRAEDGSVRETVNNGLAGSALEMDDAVRNVVAWGAATFEEAIEMASLRPLAALAPALARFGAPITPGEVIWDDKLRVVAARVGGVEIVRTH